MNSNKKMWNSIKILMEKSFWGKSSSINSLSLNLQAEVDEFKQACKNDDSLNALEEAADVLMMILCMLHHVTYKDDCVVDEVIDRVIEKLYWRYGNLYQNKNSWKEKTELEQWDQAKEIEHQMELMFCVNNECTGLKKAGIENIRYESGRYWCKLCGKEIIPSSNTVLFYRDKKAVHYIKIICNSIVAYSEGNDKTAEALNIDHPDAFHALCSQLLYKNSEKNDILSVFIDYVHRKYSISVLEIEKYLCCIKEIRNKMNTEGLMEKYYNRICSGVYDVKNFFEPHEWKKIAGDITNKTFDVAKSIKRTSCFHARNWDNQIIDKYLLNYPKRKSKEIIECMTLIHYCGAKVRDLTIEISNMYNCVVKCQFCASGALPGAVQYLEALDYVKQLNTCLFQSGIDPNNFDNFYVSFAGIGEPSVLYRNIAAGMVIMRDLYPHIQFNIATLGYQKECFSYWKNLDLPIRTIQIPLYHIEYDKLKKIVPTIPQEYELSKIIYEAIDYQSTHARCRIKINYIPMKGINDSEADIRQFANALELFKDKIVIKISILNYTKPAEENGYITPGVERLKEIKGFFSNCGFEAYVFGSERNTALGCGQLAQDNISGDA